MDIKLMQEAEGRFFISEMPKTAIDVENHFLVIHQWQWGADTEDETLQSIVLPIWFVEKFIELLKAATKGG